MDLDLAETVLGYFNGVFGRPNFSFVGIEILENRVQGRRFAGPSRSDTEDDPVRFLRDGLNDLQSGGGEFHRVEGHRLLGRKETQHDIFVLS